MSKISFEELRTKLSKTIDELGERIKARDLEGAKLADMKIHSIKTEIKKRKLELELDLY